MDRNEISWTFLGACIVGPPLAIRAPVRAVETTSDLTLWNLFSAGLTEPWSKRPHEGRAPDIALLRVQTNFLVEWCLGLRFGRRDPRTS